MVTPGRLVMGERLALTDAELTLFRQVWPREAAAALFACLFAEIAWEQHELQLFGRRVRAPRLSAWYGDCNAGYAYSGLQLSPRDWIAPLRAIKSTVEELSNSAFNSVLVNCYRQGSDSMGWHSDDEPELGSDPVIASVSFGAERVFRLRHKRERGLTHGLTLPDASVLLMTGGTQRCWQHSLPKTRRDCGQRINLTFRAVAKAHAVR